MTTLQDYLTDTADLLHDPNNRIWSQTQLIRYINAARRQTVMDTGCVRRLNLVYLTPGVESYPFGSVTGAIITNGGSGYGAPPGVIFTGGGGTGVAATAVLTNGSVSSLLFSNFGSGYTSAPAVSFSSGAAAAVAGVLPASTYDILSCNLIWGAERYAMLWKPWSDFSAKMRVWLSANYQRQPVMWSTYSDTQIFVAPPPDQPYPMEADSVLLPTDLSNPATAEPEIPPRYTDLVQFYAAYKAKFNNYDYGEANVLKKQYDDLVVERGGAYVRRIPNPYEV